MAKRKAKKKTRPKASEPALYPNSPLAEVVFEIRFLGEPAVECRRDEFFETIRKDFPKVWVPNAEPGTPPSLQPYHFKAADESETVMVAINRFAYASRSYPGFEKFSPRALLLARRFCEHFGIKRINRTGLRYINIIPFMREGSVIPWKRYFAIEMTLPPVSSDDFLNVGLSFESRCGAGSITTRIACAKSAEESHEAFVLDFDFAKTGSLNTSNLKSYIDESHDHTKRVFEEILSEDYKAVMRGEVLA